MAAPDDLIVRLLARRAPVHASVTDDGRILLTTVRVPVGAWSSEDYRVPAAPPTDDGQTPSE